MEHDDDVHCSDLCIAAGKWVGGRELGRHTFVSWVDATIEHDTFVLKAQEKA